MTLRVTHQETEFGIGDTVRVFQKVEEKGKKRLQVFEGIVIAIKGVAENRSFTVRRIGTGQIGIERIFPLFSPTIEKVSLEKSGGKGVRRAKLYYIRDKSKKEIEKIYSRVSLKDKQSAKLTSKRTKSKKQNK